MPGGAILDVAIGLFFLYLLLSMISTVVQEAIASVLELRGKNLFKGIDNLLKDESYTALAAAVYAHPAVKGLYRRPGDGTATMRKPSYIPSETFAVALLDTLRREVEGEKGERPTDIVKLGIDDLLADADTIVDGMKEGDLKVQLKLLVGDLREGTDEIAVRAEKAKRRLQTWFDLSMDRVSGWYKRQSQYIAIALGIGLAVLTNADSLFVAQRLWTDDALRAAAAQAAGAYAARPETGSPEQPPAKGFDAAATLELIKDSRLPVGWIYVPAAADRGEATGAGVLGLVALQPHQNLVQAVLGWIVTGFAVSLGASFWFNTLGRILKLRGSGAPVETETGGGGASARGTGAAGAGGGQS